ncbi:ROK family transcriptional regulator [Bifidobacterium sp. 82T10]|uniref:ROK family transcriptional regulator n=1 Tax=Bifidobacterium miconis TaxID=2834435 RepID=A0ABS6WGV9_9BIFI|nr:ROK family transcriptional regulator [Bifidobacterium miconis]MBW3093260.1 ROK family transcriptional regulator [Bifidobacterium miconis]
MTTPPTHQPNGNIGGPTPPAITAAATTATTTATDTAASAPRDHTRTAILRHLYRHRQATKQRLAHELGLSLPTVTQHLRELERAGIVVPGDPQASTGGRKAVPYAFNPRHRIAVGVSAGTTETTLLAIDLYGDIVARLNRTIPYRNDAAYWQRVAGIADEFANAATSPVIGVAFCSRGIVSATAPDPTASDAQSSAPQLMLADATGTPGCSVQSLRQLVHRTLTPMRDADADATAELWFDRTIRDAVCIYLDRRPCGAIVVNGRLHQNAAFRDGMIEHMALVPGGRPCYCGQRGCMDVYCSPETLPEDYESLPGFFSVLEQGETHHRERMNEWLDRVAQAIANVRSVIAGDVIVGGEAAQYLDDDDIADLRSRVAKLSPFGGDGLRLRRGLCMDGQPALGAALRLVDDWLDDNGCR